MKNHHFLILSILSLIFAGLFAGFFVDVFVSAQEMVPESLESESLAKITFPIPELGNCQNRADCENYCEQPENAEACLNFAEAYDLIPQEEIAQAQEMLAQEVIEGPGGCRNEVECEVYCNNINHLEECLIFAEAHNLLPPEELEEIRKVVQAIRQGITPPDCKNKSECDVYCSQPENMKECITFATAAGLIPPDELEKAKKVLAAIEKGATPPPCQGKEECDIYCSQTEHIKECIDFAEAAGFISSEEAAIVRKTGGKGPGGCQGKEECEVYCDDPTNTKECLEFAIQYNLIPVEEAEKAKKMLELGLTGGPGGCRSEEECEAFCNDLSHRAECVDFAEKMGFMTSEEASRAKKMAEMGITTGPGGCDSEDECRTFCDDPANMGECLNFAVRIGEMTPEEAEKARQGMEFMQTGGPGGCRSQEECEAYCEDPVHLEECVNFAEQIGEISPEEATQMRQRMEAMERGGPGGCRTGEECTAYCEDPSHLMECLNFAVEQGKMSQEEANRIMEMMRMKTQEMPSPIMETPPLEEMLKQPSPEEMAPQKMVPEEMGAPPERYKMEPPEGMKAPSEQMMTPPGEGEKMGPSPSELGSPVQ